MSEGTVIERTPSPRTRESIAADLDYLGLAAGTVVIVHSSLSALGWVCGGPEAVIGALMDVVTPAGTIVMPAQTGDRSEPSHWGNPPVPREWWDTIRQTMPPFDPRTTPSRGMGEIAELFRTWPGVLRSNHPHVSFTAWGAHAETITAGHTLDLSLGEGSPLARIYDLDGWVLLLGVGYGNNTSFHLAEYRVCDLPLVENSAPIMRNGRRVWATWCDVDVNVEPFVDMGAAFEPEGEVRTGYVGSAQARLFRQRPSVDFAARWLAAQRGRHA